MRSLAPRAVINLLLAGLFAAAAPGLANAEPPAETAPAAAPRPATRPDRHPELKRLSRTEEGWIDKAKQEVVVGGRVVLDKGPIEVFACVEKTKEHEAIVATRSTARLVHAALLAIGLDPGNPASFADGYAPAKGPMVRVRMRWKDAAGKAHEAQAQDWIRDHGTGKPLAGDWVFAGSVFWQDPNDGAEYYQADGGDLICVSNFPTAMLDLPFESSQQNAELAYEAFEGRVPPRDTDVEIVLSPAD
ncbi:MAG: YdjY domain-containing protein [Planctomycetia bacterium]